MNKLELVAVFVIIIISLSIVCGHLFYQTVTGMQRQISDLENQNSVLESQVSECQNQLDQFEEQASVFQTRIVAVSITGGGPICGLSVMTNVNVTVQNFGKYDVKDLNVSIRHRSETARTEWAQIELVEGGKIQNASIQVWHVFARKPEGYAVTLMSGDRLLDELITDARGYPPE